MIVVFVIPTSLAVLAPDDPEVALELGAPVVADDEPAVVAELLLLELEPQAAARRVTIPRTAATRFRFFA